MRPTLAILPLALLLLLPATATALGVDTPLCTVPGPDGAYIIDCGTGNVIPPGLVGTGLTVGNGCANARAQVLGRFIFVGNNPCPNGGSPNLFLCTVPSDNSYVIDCGTGNWVPDGIVGAGFTIGNGCANVRWQVVGRFFVIGGPCPA